MRTQDFFNALWPDDLPGHIYIWTTPDRKTYSFNNVAAAADKALNCNGHDVYFGLGLSPRALGSGERTKSEDVAALPGLWADIDVAGPGHKGSGLFPSKDAVVEWAQTLPLKPSIAVWSGGGFHLYWVTNDPIEPSDCAEIGGMAALARGWENYLKNTTQYTIDTVSDLARVLRVPGTKNHKNKPALPVEVVFSDDSRRYNPDDFEQYIIVDDLPHRSAAAVDDAVAALSSLKSTAGLSIAGLRKELWQLRERWFDGSYSDWIDVMFCVHHETGGSDEGLDLFDEWSQQSIGRYCGRGKLERHWRSVRGYQRGGKLLTWASARKWIREDTVADAVVANVVGKSGAVERFLEGLKDCTDKASVVRLIGAVRLSSDVLWEVEKPIQVRMREVVGTAPPVSVVRSWLQAGSGTTELEELPEWAGGWCYLTHQNMFYCLNNGALITEKAFNMQFAAECENASKTLSEGGVLPIYWNALYMPGAAQEFIFEDKECINLWRSEPVVEVDQSRVDAVWQMVEDHARSRYPVKWHVLIDYLAWCAQNPGEKILWMPVLQGVQGDGKSYWGKLMAYALGGRNVSQISTAEIQSNFTDWAVGGMFGVIEELRISGDNRWATIDKLKPFITNDVVNVLPKGLRGYSAPNVCNYIAFTNHKDAVPVDEGDRRFLPFFSEYQQRDQLEDGAYFEQLYNETLYTDNGAIVRHKLLTRVVGSDFCVFQPPVVAGDLDKAEMIDMVKSDLRLAIEEIINDCLVDGVEDGYGVRSKDVKDLLTNPMGNYRLKVSSAAVKRELAEMGWTAGHSVKRRGKTIKVWKKVIKVTKVTQKVTLNF